MPVQAIAAGGVLLQDVPREGHSISEDMQGASMRFPLRVTQTPILEGWAS